MKLVMKTIINEEKKYWELKESIRMINVMKLLITIWNINMYKYKVKSYCLKCRKDTENINPKVSKTSNGRTMLL